MTRLVYLDTGKLHLYQRAPDNYCHFILGNLFEVFVALSEASLLEVEIELTHNNPSPHFERLYSLFSSRPVRRSSEPPAGAQCLSLVESADWTTLDAKRDLSLYLPLFQQFVWRRLSVTPRGPGSRVTWIQRNAIASNRYVINEAMLARRLAAECRASGLELSVVDFAQLSFEAQVSLMANTRVLIGIHGAGLVNSLFLPPCSRVIELLPHRRFNAEFFRVMGLAKGNLWLRALEPSWSVPSLYNLLLACVQPGHTQRNRYYRDRNPVFEPRTISRALQLALAWDAAREQPAGVDVKLEPSECTFARKLALLHTHRKPLIALAGAGVTALALHPFPWFWLLASAAVAAACFS